MGKTARNALISVIVLAIAAGAAWQFGLLARFTLFQQWEGVLEDAYRIHNPAKQVYSPHDKDNPLEYDYYWRIRKDEGDALDIVMPIKMWQKGAKNQRVIKKIGSRWPVLVDSPASAPAAAPPKTEDAAQKPAQ